jgi:hypothetical protein
MKGTSNLGIEEHEFGHVGLVMREAEGREVENAREGVVMRMEGRGREGVAGQETREDAGDLGREGGRERGRERGREGGRDLGKNRGNEGGRGGGREGGREGGKAHLLQVLKGLLQVADVRKIQLQPGDKAKEEGHQGTLCLPSLPPSFPPSFPPSLPSSPPRACPPALGGDGGGNGRGGEGGGRGGGEKIISGGNTCL